MDEYGSAAGNMAGHRGRRRKRRWRSGGLWDGDWSRCCRGRGLFAGRLLRIRILARTDNAGTRAGVPAPLLLQSAADLAVASGQQIPHSVRNDKNRVRGTNQTVIDSGRCRLARLTRGGSRAAAVPSTSFGRLNSDPHIWIHSAERGCPTLSRSRFMAQAESRCRRANIVINVAITGSH